MSTRFVADAVLLVHFGFVLFVVGGLVAIVGGNVAGWRWVNGRGFRLAHLGAIGFVVLQSWLGQMCPLTWLESWLRRQAGGAGYHRSFIEHWVHQVLFYEAAPWVFVTLYTLFGLMVAAAWWRFPPR